MKAYYKYRLRKKEVTTISKLDVRTSGGIIADGYYSFRKPDNQIFSATFEATSYHTKSEVQYRLQKAVFFWDGLAIASLLTAFILAYGYSYDHFTIKQIGLFASISLCLISLITIMFLFRLVAAQFHRYRYIYAVEQFKRYHADEQWVAYGEDVFENPDDKYLRELKHQCVLNGFGLLKVDKQREPHVLITPARHETFKGKRQSMSFLAQGKWLEKMSFNNAPPWWQKGLNFLKNTGGPGSVLRFQKSFWNQVLVTTISFCLMGVIFYREIQDADLVHVDRTTYLEDLTELDKKGNDEEAKIFVVDTAVNVAVDEQNWWDDDVETKDQKPTSQKAIKSQTKKKGEIIVGQGNEASVTYDCSRFFNLNGTKYIITEGSYSQTKDALIRLTNLENSGLTANILWLGCFSDTENDYVVYFNEFYNSEKEAYDQMNYYFMMDDIDFNDLKIKTIQSKK